MFSKEKVVELGPREYLKVKTSNGIYNLKMLRETSRGDKNMLTIDSEDGSLIVMPVSMNRVYVTQVGPYQDFEIKKRERS